VSSKFGRRRKLTPEKIEEICKWISEGQTIEVAAGLSGVSRGSVFSWLDQGRNAEAKADAGEELNEMESLCFDFLDAFEKADAQWQKDAVETIRIAEIDPRNWTAAMTRLERRKPKQWGRHAPKQPETTTEDRTLIVKHEIPGFNDE